MLTWTGDPLVWNHSLVAGDGYAPVTVELEDGAGAPLDLTDATVVVQIRTEPLGDLVLEPTGEVLAPATGGRFRWSAPASATAEVPPGIYFYGVQVTWPGEDPVTLLHGRVTVRAGIVR